MNQKGLMIALFASAALNLFLIGGVVGGLVIAEKYGASATSTAPRRAALVRAGDSLPDEDRQAFRAALKDAGSRVAEQNQKAKGLRRSAWQSMTAETFDQDSAKRQLAEARRLEGEARSSLDDQVIDFAQGLSASSRAILAEGLSATTVGPGDKSATKAKQAAERSF